MDTLADRIRLGMSFSGITTAAQLARKLDNTITRQYAAKLISGEARTDSFTLLMRMARVFHVSMTWLGTGKGNPTPRAVLTPNEALLIELYRKASPPNRDAAIELLATPKRAQARK